MTPKLVKPTVEHSDIKDDVLFSQRFTERPRKRFYLRQLKRTEQIDLLAELSTYITPHGSKQFSKITDAVVKIPNIRIMQAIYDLTWNYTIEFGQSPRFLQSTGFTEAQIGAAKERAESFERIYGQGSYKENKSIGLFWEGLKMFDNTRRDTASMRSQKRSELGAVGEASLDRSNPSPEAIPSTPEEERARKERIQLNDELAQLFSELRAKEREIRDLNDELRSLQAKTDVVFLREATRRKKLAKLQGNETYRIRQIKQTDYPNKQKEIEDLLNRIEALESQMNVLDPDILGSADSLRHSRMYEKIGHVSRSSEGKATSYLYYVPEQTFIRYILYGLLDFLIEEIRSQTVGFSDVYMLPKDSLLVEYIASVKESNYTFQIKATGYREYSEAPPQDPLKVGVFLKDKPTIHFEGGFGRNLEKLFFDRNAFLLPAFENRIVEAERRRVVANNKFVVLPTKIDARKTKFDPKIPTEAHLKVRYTEADFYNLYARIYKDLPHEDILAFTFDPRAKLITPAVYQPIQIWEELCEFVGDLEINATPALSEDEQQPLKFSVYECPTFIHLMYTFLGVFPAIEVTNESDEADQVEVKRGVLYQRLNPSRRTRV